MGIKFLCPNGHKLNVKSFLAGKKGVCPKCGVSLRIPAASEGNLTDDAAGDSDAPLGGAVEATARPNGAPAALAPAAPAMSAGPVAVGAPAMPGPQPAAAVPVGGPVAARPAMPVAGMPAVGMPAVGMPAVGAPVGGVPMAAAPAAMPVAGMPVAGMPPMPMAHATGPVAMPPGAGYGMGDPIAEAPAATWYVRPPGGGQYGPARGDVMRKWIAEGRVSSDSLVWREGWTDWRNAGQLFPNLAAVGGGGAGAAANPIASIPKVTSGARSAGRYQAKQKSSTGMAIGLLVMLALACVVLVGVLVYVLANLE